MAEERMISWRLELPNHTWGCFSVHYPTLQAFTVGPAELARGAMTIRGPGDY